MTDLSRFVVAQEGIYLEALAELRRGRKQSHWIWFVFPQIAGLGHSAMAQLYAIADLAEARAYLAHPILGPRLRECTEAMLAHADTSAPAILGEIDSLKLRSSMTLFEAADGEEPLFGACLDEFFDAVRDPATIEILRRA